MGFWGKLGKGLLKAAPVAAGFIPGVGGLVGGLASKGLAGKAAGVLSGIGPQLSSMAQGRAQGRQAEAEQGQRDDQIRGDLARLGAQRAQFEQESPRTRAQQAAFGDFLGSYKSLGGRSQGQGFGPSGQAAGAKLAQIALERQGKDTFAVPELSKRPQANAFDKILGIAAPAASAIGGLSGLFQPKQPSPQMPPMAASTHAGMPGMLPPQMPPPLEDQPEDDDLPPLPSRSLGGYR